MQRTLISPPASWNSFSTNCKIWDFCPSLLRSGTGHFLQRTLQWPILNGLQFIGKKSRLQKQILTARAMNIQTFLYTCEVEDLGPLLANVDADVRPSYSQVSTTLIKHKGLHLKQKREWDRERHKGWKQRSDAAAWAPNLFMILGGNGWYLY